MSEFLPSLDAEIGRLEKAVEAIPEVVKLRELRRVRALYEQGNANNAASGLNISSNALRAALHNTPSASPGRRMSAERQRALDLLEEQLGKEIGIPVRTSTL